MLDPEMFEEWLMNLTERFDAFDLVEILDDKHNLSARDVVEAFREKFYGMYCEEYGE